MNLKVIKNIYYQEEILKPLKNKGVLTKVRKRKADKSYEVYMALYQGISGTDEASNIYKQFSKDFFDLIIVDECHRGSAKINSAWKEILKHFSADYTEPFRKTSKIEWGQLRSPGVHHL